MNKLIGRYGIILTKIALFGLMLLTFFGFFSIEFPDLLSLSRVTVISVITYIAVNLMLFPIYGGYSFGTREKQVTESCIIVITYIADVITAVQIGIYEASYMGLSEIISFRAIGLLFGVMALQGIFILVGTNVGTSLYCRSRIGMKILFISNLDRESEKLKRAICRSLNREKLDLTVDYREPNITELMKDFDTVFVSDVPYSKRQELIEAAYGYNLNIFFTPEICDVIGITAEHRMYDDRLVLKSPKAELSFFQRIIKRFWDVVFSAFALVLSSPVMLFCALYIKLDDGGSIFFRQERATRNGRPFKILKFRTMKPNDETHPATADDDRITRAGRFLRSTRLDELPQFWNVLKGEMSVVGPRPEQVKYIHGFDQDFEQYEYRLRVKAGITGYAQIEGRYNTTNKEKLLLDLIYIQDYSLWLDLKLVLQTIIVLFKNDSTQGFSENDEKEMK